MVLCYACTQSLFFLYYICTSTTTSVFLFQLSLQLQFGSLLSFSGLLLRSPMSAPLSWSLGLLSAAMLLSCPLWMSLSLPCVSNEDDAIQESALNCICQSSQGLAGSLWLQEDHQWLCIQGIENLKDLSHRQLQLSLQYTYSVQLEVSQLGSLQQLDASS